MLDSVTVTLFGLLVQMQFSVVWRVVHWACPFGLGICYFVVFLSRCIFLLSGRLCVGLVGFGSGTTPVLGLVGLRRFQMAVATSSLVSFFALSLIM